MVSADKPKVKEIAITSEVTADDIKATNSKTVAEALATGRLPISWVPGPSYVL